MPRSFFGQLGADDAVGFGYIGFPVLVTEFCIRFNAHPLGPRQIGCRNDPGQFGQHAVGHVGTFERQRDVSAFSARCLARSAAKFGNGKYPAADLPDMRAAPLHHIGGGSETAAEGIILVKCHRALSGCDWAGAGNRAADAGAANATIAGRIFRQILLMIRFRIEKLRCVHHLAGDG